MKAKAYLTQVRKEYRNLREMRGRLAAEKDPGKQQELRELLKKAAAYYTGILNSVWDTIEQVEEEADQEVLVRKYVFLETGEEIAGEMNLSRSTVSKYHLRALGRLQRVLDGKACDAA